MDYHPMLDSFPLTPSQCIQTWIQHIDSRLFPSGSGSTKLISQLNSQATCSTQDWNLWCQTTSYNLETPTDTNLGMAMGTSTAVNYANLYIRLLEATWLFQQFKNELLFYRKQQGCQSMAVRRSPCLGLFPSMSKHLGFAQMGDLLTDQVTSSFLWIWQSESIRSATASPSRRTKKRWTYTSTSHRILHTLKDCSTGSSSAGCKPTGTTIKSNIVLSNG